MTFKPGLYPNIEAAQYHADDLLDVPTLSNSIAKVLLSQSPLHAWTNHPKLNPNHVAKTDEKFDLGTIVHSLVLQGIDVAEILAFPDYKTNAAKEARDLARAHGRIPILTKHYHDVEQMVTALWRQLADIDIEPPLFQDGQPEVTVVWDEQGVACKARLDWLQNDHSTITDLKTTSRSARDWDRRALYDHGCDSQAAMHMRAVRALTGQPVAWRWVVVETSPPYALQIFKPDAATLAMGNDKVDRALAIWRECLEQDHWPGYTPAVRFTELPAWEESRWLEREAREEMAA